MTTPLSSVLVVIADGDLRQLVGSIVDQMELKATLMTNWPQTIIETTPTTIGRPSCLIVDLDDTGRAAVDEAKFALELLSRDWGGSVPLVVLSRRPDVADLAAALGALAGIRKPINVGALMDAVRRAVAPERLQ